MYSLDYFGGVLLLIGIDFFGLRDKVTKRELKKVPGGRLFELDPGEWK